MMEIGFIVSGFAVGTLVGLTGVGGGSLMTPLLIFLFGIKPALAVGTDLLYASLTKSVGIFAHTRLGGVDWRVVRYLSLGSLPTSLATVLFLRQIDVHTNALVDGIKFWLGIALLLTAVAVLLRPYIQAHLKQIHELPPTQQKIVTVLLGIVLGGLVTLTSVGAGALGVTALLVLYPRSPIARIVGTDIAHAVPLTLVAGLGHASLGTVDYHLLGVLLIGSVPGIWLGSHLSHKINEHWTRLALAIILVFVGIKLIAN